MTATMNPNDFLFSGGGAATADMKTIGNKVKGRILDIEVTQQTDAKTGEVKTFSDGKPMLQLVVTLQTSESDGDEDDGKRRIFAKGGKVGQIAEGKGKSGKDAIADAVRDVGAATLEEGGELIYARTGTAVPTSKAMDGMNLFTAKYTPPTKSVDLDDL